MQNFKRLSLIALIALAFNNANAQAQTDLVLEGERWVGKWTGYVCDDGNTEAAEAPAELMDYGVEFTHIGADYSLDNVTIRAQYQENGVTCNYSSILFADNDAWTVELVESRVYPADSCASGKELMDQTFEMNDYKYLHGRVAVYVPFSNSQMACGSENIGIHFQVTGKKE